MESEPIESRDQEQDAFRDEPSAGQLRARLALLGDDLRDPLQAIFASSDLLARQLASAAHSQIAERIKAHARRMATLIDEVLDYARGRSGGEISAALAEITDLNAGLMSVIHELQDDETDYRVLPDFHAARSPRCDVGHLQKAASNLGNVPMHGPAHHPLPGSSQEGPEGFVLRRTESLKG